jgi:hypothetical protein
LLTRNEKVILLFTRKEDRPTENNVRVNHNDPDYVFVIRIGANPREDQMTKTSFFSGRAKLSKLRSIAVLWL